MIPPTPTNLPPGTAYFNSFQGFTLWDSTGTAIQSWNMLGAGRDIIQVLFLLFVLILIIYTIYRFTKDFQRVTPQD